MWVPKIHRADWCLSFQVLVNWIASSSAHNPRALKDCSGLHGNRQYRACLLVLMFSVMKELTFYFWGVQALWKKTILSLILRSLLHMEIGMAAVQDLFAPFFLPSFPKQKSSIFYVSAGSYKKILLLRILKGSNFKLPTYWDFLCHGNFVF